MEMPHPMPLSQNDETNPFLETPRSKRVRSSQFGSPTPSRSPSRRGIIKMESSEESGSLSPLKTPNGRAGLASPRRRNPAELDASARKRASNTYARLMEDEDVEDEDALLKEQELQLAEQIIRESKNVVEIFEPDLINDAPILLPPKRKRGRPRKEEVAKRLAEQQTDLTPKRRERRAIVERREALRQAKLKKQEEEEANRIGKRKYHSSDEDRFSEDEDDEIAKKGKKVRKTIKKSPRKLSSNSPGPGLSPERRTKKGRPSKQENVTKQVHSIFQMDDLAFFQDNINSSGTNTPITSPQKVTNYLNFDNNGDSTFSSVPTISGIANTKSKEKSKDLGKLTKFEPMPIPDVDEDGNVKDPKYMAKYFRGIDFEAETNGRLTDERAFFLEGSEGYFEQHNLRFRPSFSSLTSKAPTLEYEEFIPMVNLGSLIHNQERKSLNELHKTLNHQWCFELSQGYSLNFYGVGSKSNFILDFVNGYLLDWYEKVMQEKIEYPVVMVVNGYNPSTKLKTVIHDIIAAVITPEIQKQQNLRMPKHVAEAFPYLLNHLKKHQSIVKYNGLVKPDLILVVHNIDGEAFRDERSQNYLSELASLPNVWFITSTDNVNASLLWDLNRFKNSNFLWHDLTTYEPYSVEMSFKDVLSMGQSKKFLGSKGARYVLTSLSTNAKNLYRLLLQAQLKKLEDTSTKEGRTGLRANVKLAVEFRSLFEQCKEAFVTSNEMNFRSILGEYVEHKMCTLTRNGQGTEVVFVPFSFDEMEKLLREEFGIQG